MNRVIKFRAFNKKNNSWVYLSLSHGIMSINYGFESNCDETAELGSWLQSTGFLDKNVKEIYEGDEMSGEDAYGEKIRGVVKFIDGAFVLISNNHFWTQAGHSNHSHTYFRDMASQLEITGLVVADLKVTEE